MYRFVIALSVVGCLLMGVSTLVAADATARAIIDKAIKARGGETALAKLKSVSSTLKGTYYGMGAALPRTLSYQQELPDRSRIEIEGLITTVLNKDKGWVIMGGQ